MAKGKQLAGGELEAMVMDLLWDRGGWMTPGEVHEVLDQARPLAYNTVLTILTRLCEKGRLERQRDGRAYAYRPTQSREQHAASRMETILGDVRDRPAALAHFLESLPDDDRNQLRRLLNRLRGVT
jgi:predicted transcriptional regulator